jgi:hypothetical protein
MTPTLASVLPTTPERNIRPTRTAVETGRLGETVGPMSCLSDTDAMSEISTELSSPINRVTAVARAGGPPEKYRPYSSFIASKNESSVRNTRAATTLAYERPTARSSTPALSRIVRVCVWTGPTTT